MAKKMAGPNVPPTLPPHRAIELIRRQLDEITKLEELPYNAPTIGAWENTTKQILNQTFGKPGGELEDRTKAFAHATSGMPLYIGMSDGEKQEQYRAKLARRSALLEGFIDQLEILTPPATLTAPPVYDFHPEIEKTSGEMFRDGHYKQAALEAYIRVIAEVKTKSGLALDGDRLMNRAFGCTNQQPVIRFNDLESDAERDEQTGFLYLFKGIVGLRNSKAHSNRLFDDPRRGFEYLALASLLMRVLEIARLDESV